MKGLRLILSVCLGATYFYGARADIDGDAARAAARRGAITATTQTRQKPTATHINSATTTRDASTVANRAVSTGTAATQSRSVINTSARENAVTSRGAATGTVVTRTPTVTPRTGATPRVTSRTATRTATVVPQQRTVTSAARTHTSATGASRQSRAAINTTARAAVTNATPRRTSNNAGKRLSRAAATAGTIAPGNYKECRTVYYECMDEFCANKDSQLRRCACSARMSEFDGLKEQMTQVQDKLLDFNQRLLTVNMDKEDAIAINTATEGELAFSAADKSDSKKMLDDISKKLNDTFNNSKLDNDLSAISLSLDVDSAFDNLDSMMGADTVIKSGDALYSAALPVCREMAAEVCSDDELAIAENGYQMMIEQDCNTVAKSYASQAESAREKIREGGALLDMSRLNIHQTRNSDDILTCKAKMLDMLGDTTVCGDKLGKCLDTSGQYIDPTTGTAFLSENLYQLATLITRPSADQTWTSAPGNEKFVTFLNSKKKFLAPAMENCQDIADAVWDAFIEDALAQIKLAQDAKLEDMRQSCTQLVAQCMTDTAKSISEFDTRALSIFGVRADKTVREMCRDIQTSCTALLEKTGGGGTDWGTGIDSIATDKSYETLLYTCREVGKNCIIQNCKSTSGNFGLCSDIQTSVNRKSIINRRACWDEVRTCINAAGDDTLGKIIAANNNIYDATDEYRFYDAVYGENIPVTENGSPADSTRAIATNNGYNNIFDICAQDCNKNNPNLPYSEEACIECRLAERIWGNCEYAPAIVQGDHNRILKSKTGDGTDTLLAWFAAGTNTDSALDNCRDTTCGDGMQMYNGQCRATLSITTSNENCSPQNQFTVYGSEGSEGNEGNEFKNCCGNKPNNNYGCAQCGGNTDDSYKWYKMPAIVGTVNNEFATEYYTNNSLNFAAPGDNAIYLPSTATNNSSDLSGGTAQLSQLASAQRTSARADVCWGEYCLVCVNSASGDTKPISCNSGANANGEYFVVDSKGRVFAVKDLKDVADAGPTAIDKQKRTNVENYYKVTCDETNNSQCTQCLFDPKEEKQKWKTRDGANSCTPAEHWIIKYK